MKNISVAIATYNEEENIGRCLDSIRNFCSEIIVVDGESQDKTAEIARQKGARVISVKNQQNFHKNKKIAIENCNSEWILQLDADEVVSVQLRREIQHVVNLEQVNGYWIPRKNYFLGKWLSKGGQYPDYTLRLYRRGKGNLQGKSVHEQAIVAGKTGYLKSPLLHFAYPSFSRYLDHFNRYTEILAQELKEKKLPINFITLMNYFAFKSIYWFLITFIRHKGFQDGFAGFVFSLFSSLRFTVSYIKYWEMEFNKS